MGAGFFVESPSLHCKKIPRSGQTCRPTAPCVLIWLVVRRNQSCSYAAQILPGVAGNSFFPQVPALCPRSSHVSYCAPGYDTNQQNAKPFCECTEFAKTHPAALHYPNARHPVILECLTDCNMIPPGTLVGACGRDKRLPGRKHPCAGCEQEL
jgi:hypothetical protein